MKGFIQRVVLSCLIFTVSSRAIAQTHTYEIRYGNHPIGNVTANCRINGAAKKIAIQSKVEMKLLAKFNLDISCEFENNLMVRSKVVRSSGKDADNKSITTQREGKNYTIIQNGEKSVLNNTEIIHSVAELYFEEPRQITRIYSETQGTFLTLKALGDGLYELQLPEGKKNLYKYEKGTLMQVEVTQALGKAYIVKVS